MADEGYVRSKLRGISNAGDKQILTDIFVYLMQNLRLGVPEHQQRATNLQAYWMQSTSASDTSEFSIAHGLPNTPHYAIPVLELDRPGAKVVPMEVSRAADSRRIYLKVPAGSTGAPFTLLVEG